MALTRKETDGHIYVHIYIHTHARIHIIRISPVLLVYQTREIEEERRETESKRTK